jgi:hypothetical protein
MIKVAIKNMNMLDQTAPGLSEQLRHLSPEQWRRIVAKVCEMVSQSITDLEPIVRTSLGAAVEKNWLSSDQIKGLRNYAENADKKYFTLQEEGVEQTVWRSWFAKARLATALADVFSNEQWETVADAVYELCFIDEDNSRVINFVESSIESMR